jgi:hypothetical protein
MNPQKFKKIDILSFRRKPEASHFNSFWTPAPAPDIDPGFAGVTVMELCTKALNY